MPDADEVNEKPMLKVPLFAAAETGTPDTDEVHRKSSTNDSQSDGEDQDVLSTKRVSVRELQEGDLLLWGIPAHAQRVARVSHERLLGGVISRYLVSLADVDGIQEDYRLSPGRRVVVTTDERMPVATWSDVAKQFFEEMSHDDSPRRRLTRRLLKPLHRFSERSAIFNVSHTPFGCRRDSSAFCSLCSYSRLGWTHCLSLGFRS